MAVTPTYPGVYINETASIPHAVVPATTNLTAFIGPFPQGPADEAVLVSSWPEFVSLFGGLGPRSSYAAYGGLAVLPQRRDRGVDRPRRAADREQARRRRIDRRDPDHASADGVRARHHGSQPGRLGEQPQGHVPAVRPAAGPDPTHPDLIVSDATSGATLETVSGIPVGRSRLPRT